MNKRLCLIDGSGYIFRAFYALPPMTSPDKKPVNAVYGFTNMFLKLTDKIGCDYQLVLFDAKRKNFRNEIYPDYKANRKELPEDLIPQFEIIREAVDSLNINRLEIEGYEADDLIATFSKKALAEGLDVTIVSADKDLMQLIGPGVEFYDPMKDKFFSNEDVKEKFGVYPDRVIDVQALAGDSSDNVPGVPGIGLKTAAQLINEYGSLEELLQRASEIKQNKRRETLLENANMARISKKLVTLNADVPLQIDIQSLQCKSPRIDVLNEFITKYNFKSLRPRLERWCQNHQQTDLGQELANKEIAVEYELLESKEQLKGLVEKIRQNKLFSFCAVTSGPAPSFDKLLGFAIATDEKKAYYVPVNLKTNSLMADLFDSRNKSTIDVKDLQETLKPILESKSILKIGCNLKTDLHFIEQAVGKSDVFPIDDIAVLSFVLDGSSHKHDIETLSELFLGTKVILQEDLLGKGKDKKSMSDVLPQDMLTYAAQKAGIILCLYNVLKKRLVSEHLVAVYENLDRPIIGILKQMEDIGIKVDLDSLKKLSNTFSDNINVLEKQIYELAGESFNIASPKQIGTILFSKMGYKGKKSPGGGWQTGADVLEELSEQGCEICDKILEWRAFSKLKSTYTDSLIALLDNHQRVHTTFNQTTANTGRLASSNPNLQNIPVRSPEGKKIRECFVAKSGHKIISCDYSQVELRLLATVANVKGLKKAFEEDRDLHAETAAKIFDVEYENVTKEQRSYAKAINFGIVYGMSEFGLAKQIGVSRQDARSYIEIYFKQMPEIKEYMDKTIKFAQTHGYVETPFGRKIYISDINNPNKRLEANAQRAAINAPIQGGAADIIKLAMRRVHQELENSGLKTKMLLQVHDELVFEAPDDEVERAAELIKNTMQKVVSDKLLLVAEVGFSQTWAGAH